MTTHRGAGSSYDRGVSLNNMLLISLAIHILVLTGGAFLKMSSTPRMTFGPVYSVQLVASSAVAPAPSTSLAKEITSSEAKSRDIIIRKQSDIQSKILIKKTDHMETRNAQVDRAIEKLKNKASEPTSTQGMQDRRPATAGNAKTNDYSRAIWAKIKSQWALPGGILPKQNILAIIHVRILRNGALTDISIEKRSGNAYFDNSALRAVEKSNPLPPLPEGINDSSLDVGIRFHSADLR
ncbi:MAG: TonB family protein [Syntrophales bacterium]|nr:TonB family protein [Syntrophales bacterium]